MALLVEVLKHSPCRLFQSASQNSVCLAPLAAPAPVKGTFWNVLHFFTRPSLDLRGAALVARNAHVMEEQAITMLYSPSSWTGDKPVARKKEKFGMADLDLRSIARSLIY
jgi:hypothetical protein